MTPPLLRKELAWGRRKVLPLFLLFVVLPAAFAYGTLTYQHVLPSDTPVAIVPQDGSVTADDVAITRGAVTLFSDPVTYDSRDAAFRALDRERVYAIVSVPPDVADEDTTATFHLYVEGSVVPYHQPSEAVVSVMRTYLQSSSAVNVAVERTVVGTEHTLSEYLVPTFEMVVLLLAALVYLPYTLANERGVFERLRVDSSLARVVGWKLAFFTGLVAVPLAVFAGVTGALDYTLAVTAPGAVVAYLLTFLTLAAVSMALTLLTDFATWGRLANVVLFLFLTLFSGLFYPAGFFSAARRELVRALPTHYAIVAIRGYVLRGAPLGSYADWLAGLAAVAVAALAFLRLAVHRYEHIQ